MNPAKEFLDFPSERRQTLFEEAATRRSIDPAIIEKDFWVCWLLSILFADDQVAPHLVFKGGTSLSKVFGAIDRFSEDVDLSVSPEFVGANLKTYEEAPSRSKLQKAMQTIQEQCAAKVREVIQPRLENTITQYLGKPASGSWLEYEYNLQTQSPTLFLRYPTAVSRQLPYIRPSVLLEMGSITDQQPAGKHTVRPWISDTFPEAFPDWTCELIALELPRSYWEKATILHSEFHRPDENPMPDRYARHYYDFVRLSRHPEAGILMADKEMAERVGRWKAKFFPRKWSNYETAVHGSLRLVPPVARLESLGHDYRQMQPMFLASPPTFEVLIDELTAIERKLNAM